MDSKIFKKKILDAYYTSVFQLEFAQKAEKIIWQYKKEMNGERNE